MKRTVYIIAAAALALASCQKPQFVEPTADRDGFTSITAYITTGEYKGMELVKMSLNDEIIATGTIEIPVPYYYPEESDETSTKYMQKAQMKAELADNCKLTPALSCLNLTMPNEFVYTDAKGRSTPITIIGKRTKSGNAKLMNFRLVDMFEAFIDEENRIIYLFTTDDLSNCTATAEVSAHSTVYTDLSKPTNYNEPQKIILEAHNGNHIEYTTKKATPTKTRSGFTKTSIKRLFNKNSELEMKLPAALTKGLAPSMAYADNSLIVCMGNGDTPKYYNGQTGVELGTIVLGDAVPGCISSDAKGNMLICNSLDSKGKINFYITDSPADTPVLFYSYDYDGDKPVGKQMKIFGDLKGDAVVTLVCGGVPGVTTSSEFVRLLVKGGTLANSSRVNLSNTGISWSGFFDSSAGIAPTSSDEATCGYVTGDYGSMNINYVTPALEKGKTMTMTDDIAWNWNPNALDCMEFNNSRFMSLLILNHFPAWGAVPMLYVYNIDEPNSLNGDFRTASALVFTSVGFEGGSIEPFNNVNNDNNATISSGDVLMAQSADGFKIFFYCFDQYSGVITAYSADCINREAL